MIIDDEEATRYLYAKYLTKAGFSIQHAANLAQARQAIGNTYFEAVLLDLFLPDGNGLDWLPELQDLVPNTAVVVVTGAGDIPIAVEAMRRGAENFLTKPVDMSHLEAYLKKTIETSTLKRRDRAERRASQDATPFFGNNPVMQEVVQLCRLAAKSDAPILLQGETGTGKGVMGRWIHNLSERSRLPFVEVNCSVLRGDLLSSELFGHAKGAFTSAVEHKEGLLDVADGGTLFLDEIGDMNMEVQSQFLKAVEEKKYRRLGEVRERRSDFRLICATHRDLLEGTRSGAFRSDLYYRISVVPIQIPPLRVRQQDLKSLAHYLLTELGVPHIKISDSVIKRFENYSWPGNIRELKNVLERAVLLSAGNDLDVEHFTGLNSGEMHDASSVMDDHLSAAKILAALNTCKGNKRNAAKHLGISRATLYRHLKQLDL